MRGRPQTQLLVHTTERALEKVWQVRVKWMLMWSQVLGLFGLIELVILRVSLTSQGNHTSSWGLSRSLQHYLLSSASRSVLQVPSSLLRENGHRKEMKEFFNLFYCGQLTLSTQLIKLIYREFFYPGRSTAAPLHSLSKGRNNVSPICSA